LLAQSESEIRMPTWDTAMFDEAWYRDQILAVPSPDPRVLSGSCHELREHFLNRGADLGLDPSPVFSTSWYETENADVVASGLNPLVHFVAHGAGEGRPPHPLFDPRYYLAQGPAIVDSDERRANPLLHYVGHVSSFGMDPHPLFKAAWYRERYRHDIALAGMNPLVHYITKGAKARYWPNELFDPDFYIGQDPSLRDDANALRNPLVHYLLIGAAEGRDPHPSFKASGYLAANPDVAAAAMNPLVHYLIAGRSEGRDPTGRLASRRVATRYPQGPRDGPPPDTILREPSSDVGRDRAKVDRAKRAQVRLEEFLASSERIRLPYAEYPDVTVVVVVWSQAHLTLACLESLACSITPARVVVIDNASTDQTADLLDRLEGARVVRNASNLGFVEAANAGLDASTTPFTLLLNNDATIAQDTIQQALEVARDPSVGAVAARILQTTGLLQEAGSFLWLDGSAQGYLRGQPATTGAAMHRRDVDFGSGAFLLLRTSVVQRLGGFDEAFKPAYGEDVDLCLRMQAAGYRTVYDPRVVIEHFEFASSTDPSAALALQAEHRHLIEERHPPALAHRPLSDETMAHRVAHLATRDRPGVLVVDDRLPFMHEGSGNPRAREVLRAIISSHRGPTLLAPTNQGLLTDWAPVWAEFGLELEVYPEAGVTGLELLLKQHAGRFDTIWVSRSHNLSQLLAAEQLHPGLLSGVRLIFDAEAVTAVREVQQAALAGTPWSDDQAAAAVAAECAGARSADVVLAVNNAEADLFRAHGASNVHVLGIGLEVRPSPSAFADRSGLVFVGRMAEEDSPNVDSIRWFVHEVWPQWPTIDRPTLTLVGLIQPGLAEEFSSQGARVTGPVDDIRPYLDAARVFLAPTRFAAGVPHKVYEAAAAGIPVVATPLLVEQLGWTAGRDLHVAIDPLGFAAAINRLLTSPQTWGAVRESALVRVREDCSPTQFAATIRQVLSDGSAHGVVDPRG
jgi:GT2 family glycosyltransferase